MLSSKVILGALLMLACSASARELLQGGNQTAPLPPAPPECQSQWNADQIKCRFACPVTGEWELTCGAETVAAVQNATAPPAGAGLVSCELHRTSGNKNAIIYYLCPIPMAGMVRA